MSTSATTEAQLLSDDEKEDEQEFITKTLRQDDNTVDDQDEATTQSLKDEDYDDDDDDDFLPDTNAMLAEVEDIGFRQSGPSGDDGSVDLDILTEAGVKKVFSVSRRGFDPARPWRSLWARCGLQFERAQMEARYRQKNLNSRRFYKVFIVFGLIFTIGRTLLLLFFGQSQSDISSNSLFDFVFVCSIFACVLLAVVNLVWPQTRPMWSLVIVFVLCSQLVDCVLTISNFLDVNVYQQLVDRISFGVQHSCRAANIINGTFFEPNDMNFNGTQMGTYCHLSELVGVSGYIAGLNELGRMNQNWEYSAVIVVFALPVVESLWLLILPLVTITAKMAITFFPPDGLDTTMFIWGRTDVAMSCYPIWRVAYWSLLFQVVVSLSVWTRRI